MKPNGPCKRAGVPCDCRHDGCRQTCTKYAAYQIALLNYKKVRYMEFLKREHNASLRHKYWYIPGSEGTRIKEG